MRKHLFFLALLPVSLVMASCEEDDEGAPVTVLEESPGLLAQAAVPPDSAVALARARVPGARITTAEIEIEDGRLIYTFDMAPGGEEGEEAEEAEEAEEEEEAGEEPGMITEVHVDALTGAILSAEEESGAEEAEEAEEGMEEPSGRVTEESPGLLQQAAFSPDSALALARVRYPGAQLLAGELEMEEGRLVFSLDLGIEGEEGITEVWVDALSGEILSVEHEGGGEEGGE